MIKEEEPPRPSARLSDSGATLVSISAKRHMEPAKLTKLVRGELDWIVMKALEKDRSRRYETANGSARDVGRYLADEPVLACPPSAQYRFRKFARRNKPALAMVAVVSAAVFALIVGTLVHNARLGVALQDARTNLEKATLAEEQARLAEHEKTRQLAIAHVREAQARRNSGLVGRRFESLAALKKAAEHFRALGQLDEQRTLELRNEAIACLALADLKPGKAWTPEPGWSRPNGFHPTLQYYAVRPAADDHPEKGDVHQGQLSIRRVGDDQEVARLPGFGVRAVATHFSPDGRYLAAHYERGERHNYVWDLSRREAILKVPHGTHSSFLAFSPDSRLVALSRPDQSIRIYELPSGATWKDLPPGLPVNSVHFHPDGRRLAVVSGGIVQFRDLSDGKDLATFKHPGEVAALAWRSDGKVFATGCDDHDIYLWDVAHSAQPLRTLKGHFGPAVHLAFSHGGDLLFSNSWDSTDRLWDPMTGQQLVSRPGGTYREHLFGPDDQRLDDGWQVATGRECRTFHRPKYQSWVAISPNGRFRGRLMASVGDDGLQLWDLAATREGDKLLDTLPVGESMAVHFDPKGESLITDSKRVGLQRWPITPDPETGGLRIGPPQSLGLSARAPYFGNFPDFALSADGRTVAHSPHPGQALLYDLENPSRKLLIESYRLRHAAFSPDGRWLATGNWRGRGVKVWDARTGKLAHDFDLGGSQENTALPAFSPDGKWLVTGTVAEYRFWEVGSWHQKHGLPRENAGQIIGMLTFSPDGKMLAVLHSMTEVRLVDAATGREFARLPTAGGPHCFSPDSSQLVTYAGRDGSFQVWDLRLIRRQLKEMGLDWDLPPYPPPVPESAKPLHVKVLAAEPLPPSKELDAQAYLERGLLFVQLRRYSYATVDFNRASTLDPKRPPWEQMAAAFKQATTLKADCPYAWYCLALLELQRGDRAEYRKACVRMLERFGESPSAGAAYWTAWSCVLAPDAVADWTKPLQLAEKARDDDGKSYEKINTLGAVLYRAGRFKEAAQRLIEAEAAFKATRSTGSSIVYNWFFQAMVQHRLGRAAEASSWLEKAVKEIDEPSLETAQDAATNNWNRRLTLQLLRREAEELLGKKSQ